MREDFAIAASKDVLGHIDRAADKAGLSRGEGFADFLTFVLCSFAGQTMEEEYLQTVEKGYATGKKGKRGIDEIEKAFAQLIVAMEVTKKDVLGDIFTGGITYGERGQFFTPDAICDVMAELTIGDTDEDSKSIIDPACGSGRALLSVGKMHPNWEFTGQDVDHRCTQMTAINLGLNGLRGWAVWQDTLALECYRVYRIGFNLHGGVIRELPVEHSPFNYAAQNAMSISPEAESKAAPVSEPNQPMGKQLDLF